MSTHSTSDTPPDQEAVGLLRPRGPSRLGSAEPRRANWFVRGVRSLFGYRKTSLTILMFATILATIAISTIDNSLEYSVSLPDDESESAILDYSWSVLQKLGAREHTYTSRNNDKVHDYLEEGIKSLIEESDFIDYDNDLNYTNNIIYSVKYLTYDSVSYYESNNLLVRVNGSDPNLPALLLSSHFDSVPSAYGVTDDGMGVASMMGLVKHFAAKNTPRPKRTIIFNFNNNEEFGLYGANSFLKHPWFSQIKYFLNLEGTGAGGKAILFRGTDYGIVKHFSSVRYPFANSLFQQGFNNRLIHSETDYAVYKDKGGIRGLDLAFYKPRDLYHTAGDNIKNVDRKSLWHMLSTALDFSTHITMDEIDLDDSTQPDKSTDLSAYMSFANMFFAVPISTIVVANIVLLVAIPMLSIVLLVVVLNGRKSWNLNFINVIKFPVSFALSIAILNFVFDVLIIPYNIFLANSSINTLVATLFSLFLLLNYAFLNGINAVFGTFKGHQHDEKLIVILESGFVGWLALLWSTIKLSKNRLGDDHTGEQLIPVLFLLQSFAAVLGLVGWSFKRSLEKPSGLKYEDHQSILRAAPPQNYGSNDDHSYAESSSLSIISDSSDNCRAHYSKSFSYDWLIQFLLIAPLSSFIIYNSGMLMLNGINKSIQESYAAQEMIYKFFKLFAIVWTIPFLPFIFKVNRIMVLVWVAVLAYGIISIGVNEAFDQSNPLKLRFLETINLDTTPPSNEVTISGRQISLVESIIKDMPSVKGSASHIRISEEVDGMSIYSWNSSLFPTIVPGLKENDDLLSIEVLKNSSSTSDAPFGMLTGEIKIHAPKTRNCKIDFRMSDSLTKILTEGTTSPARSPVKSVTIFSGRDSSNSSQNVKWNTGENLLSSSRENHVFKDLNGIDQLQLNKLDWDAPFHLMFQWIPEVAETNTETTFQNVHVKKLGISVECYWSELNHVFSESGEDAGNSIPAYHELLHYSPNYVSWSNRDRGLVSAKRYLEL